MKLPAVVAEVTFLPMVVAKGLCALSFRGLAVMMMKWNQPGHQYDAIQRAMIDVSA